MKIKTGFKFEHATLIEQKRMDRCRLELDLKCESIDSLTAVDKRKY